MVENYNRIAQPPSTPYTGQIRAAMNNDNLHSLPRHLIELRMAHADLNSLIDQAAVERPDDELVLRRLKKRRLLLRDQIARIEAELDPPEPA